MGAQLYLRKAHIVRTWRPEEPKIHMFKFVIFKVIWRFTVISHVLLKLLFLCSWNYNKIN